MLGRGRSTAAIAAYWASLSGRQRGGFWWRVVPAPLTAEPAIDLCWSTLWELIRGATQLKQPARTDLARRYAELLADNLGQPGFRELLIVTHDVDAGRDLVFALVSEGETARPAAACRGATKRNSVGRRCSICRHLTRSSDGWRRGRADGAARVGLSSDPVFARWLLARGAPSARRSARACSSESWANLSELNVEQIVMVSSAPESPGPHTLGLGTA